MKVGKIRSLAKNVKQAIEDVFFDFSLLVCNEIYIFAADKQ